MTGTKEGGWERDGTANFGLGSKNGMRKRSGLDTASLQRQRALELGVAKTRGHSLLARPQTAPFPIIKFYDSPQKTHSLNSLSLRSLPLFAPALRSHSHFSPPRRLLATCQAFQLSSTNVNPQISGSSFTTCNSCERAYYRKVREARMQEKAESLFLVEGQRYIPG